MHEASWPWVKWLRPSWSRKTFCQLADLSALISSPPVLSPLLSSCLVSCFIATSGLASPCPEPFSVVSSPLCLFLSLLVLLSPLVSSCLVRSGFVFFLVFPFLVPASLVSSCPVLSCLVSAGLIFSWSLGQFGAELPRS